MPVHLSSGFPYFAQRPANSSVALRESFDRTEPGDQWHILKSQWKLADGVLIGMEQPKDQHAAVIYHKAKMGNAVCESKFMFSEKTESLEFGLNRTYDDVTIREPHFSLSVNPSKWSLIKDNYADLHQDADQHVVAEQTKQSQWNRCYSACITTGGPYLTAKIDSRSQLTGSAQTFANTKSTMVFRSSNANVEIDAIQIWTQL